MPKKTDDTEIEKKDIIPAHEKHGIKFLKLVPQQDTEAEQIYNDKVASLEGHEEWGKKQIAINHMESIGYKAVGKQTYVKG